jgi:preprotein translocase SecE subunit
VANKMADKKKNANQSATRNRQLRQSQMVAPSARSDGNEQDKPVKAVARERGERKVQESKPVRRESKSQSKGLSDWQIRLRNNRYIRFILDAYYELRHKVTWPSFSEARTMTIVVILLSLAVGVVLWVADLGLYQLFLLLSHIGGK